MAEKSRVQYAVKWMEVYTKLLNMQFIEDLVKNKDYTKFLSLCEHENLDMNLKLTSYD